MQVEFRQTYKYTGPLKDNDSDQGTHLIISLFNQELHFAVKYEEGELIKYEIYQYNDHPVQDDYKQLFYRWISLNGVIPNQVRFNFCKGFFHLLPAIGFNQSNIQNLSMLDAGFERKSLVNISNDYQLVYGVDGQFVDAVHAVFNYCVGSHYVKNVYHELTAHKGLPSDVVYLHIMFGKLCLICVVEDKLQCIVEQEYDHQNDVLYYTLSVLQQYGLSPSSCPVFIGGYVAASARLIYFLKDYINVVEYLSLDSFSHLSQIPDMYEDVIINQ